MHPGAALAANTRTLQHLLHPAFAGNSKLCHSTAISSHIAVVSPVFENSHASTNARLDVIRGLVNPAKRYIQISPVTVAPRCYREFVVARRLQLGSTLRAVQSVHSRLHAVVTFAVIHVMRVRASRAPSRFRKDAYVKRIFVRCFVEISRALWMMLILQLIPPMETRIRPLEYVVKRHLNVRKRVVSRFLAGTIHARKSVIQPKITSTLRYVHLTPR